MNQTTDSLPLLGYVDKFSARPSETLSFKVSSKSSEPFTAHLMRSISADSNPEGPGIIEQDASVHFPVSQYPSRFQPFYPGSYGIAGGEITVAEDVAITMSVNVFPTLTCERIQTILSVGDHALYVDVDGTVCMRVGEFLVKGSSLKLKCWSHLSVSINASVLTLEQSLIPGLHSQAAAEPHRVSSEIGAVAVSGRPCVAARWNDGQASMYFNGKIEQPSITAEGRTICAWDFSQDIPKTRVTAIAGPTLDLVNFPTRAMTGSAWDGSEMNWARKPEHYTAIHFHEDDIYDFEWKTDFTFTIPADMPSGIYVMRLTCGDDWDAIPFFVTPPLGKPNAKLCVLVSTFTYSVYGNHARPDFHPSWMDRPDSENGYPHNPAQHPHYGLSTYNYHSDGSGICHASHRRPLFNLRPGYRTFGQTSCSGLRHFQADSHLIGWLHNQGIDYDLVTDEDLHLHGRDAIAGYKVLTTGSHPEYHTSETLDALRDYRDSGGHLLYLGGNGFYWRIAVHTENDSILEIRRAEDGIRAWAAEPGEYYNAFDGNYGGLWRRNGRAPQSLVGVGFTAQGEFFGDPYKRVNTDPAYAWVFDGIEGELIGDFGFSGHGASGFELDHMDYSIGTPDNAVLLARSVTRESGFMLVPEEQLTHLTNLSGGPEVESKHADMIYIEYPGGGSVFSVGSITFCGSLPWNNFDNNVSQLLSNVLSRCLNSVSVST